MICVPHNLSRYFLLEEHHKQELNLYGFDDSHIHSRLGFLITVIFSVSSYKIVNSGVHPPPVLVIITFWIPLKMHGFRDVNYLVILGCILVCL